MINTAEKKRSLLDITRDLLSLQYVADEKDGVLDDDLLEAFIIVEDEFNHKVDAALSVAQSLKASANAMRDRVRRIQEHYRMLENKSSRLEEWVQQNMEAAEIECIETSNFPLIKLAKKAPSVKLDEPTFLTWAVDGEYEQYIKRPDPKPAKKEILAALKRGEKIRGAELLTGGKRLTYR